MPAGDPIKLGSASGVALTPTANSRIQTDDYGVQRGTVTYQLGDQSSSQSVRLSLGSSYSGTLPQFNGFLVNRSGDITGVEGTAAMIDVEYVRLDPLWINIPLDSNDLEIKNLKTLDTSSDTSGLLSLFEPFITVLIPILHPTVSYRYSSLTPKSDLGTFGTPNGAPTIAEYVFALYVNANYGVSQVVKIITGEAIVITRNFNTTCTLSTVPTGAIPSGLWSQNQNQVVNPFNLHFKPDPKGWLCIRQDQRPLAAGSIYEIDEKWKIDMLFSGTSQGNWVPPNFTCTP